MSDMATIVSGLLSGSICGGLTIASALLAVKYGIRELEKNEVRKQKVECIVNLYGLRFALAAQLVSRDEDRTRSMFELNRAGALFADSENVQKNLRDFSAEHTNQRFIALLKSMGHKTFLPMDKLSDADVQNIFLLPLAGTSPANIPASTLHS